MLLCPLLILAHRVSYLHCFIHCIRPGFLSQRRGLLGSVVYVMVTLAWTGLLFCGSHYLTGSWDFLSATHGVILTVPDLTPNVGLFWYFFTEAFEHFRVFFLCVFQINAFLYVLPLSFRFSEHPVFLAYVLLSLMALFKSYPSVGDLALPLSLLPLWSHTFRYLRYTLVVLCMFLMTSVLCPVFWYLWIHAGSANANFFFATTLAYSLAQVFLVSDVMYSFLVHRYDLCHGLPRVDSHGHTIALALR
ncbi:Phosphatidylinositol glycan anchor biosynthesis class U protein [Geodia barretti]|uniref:Phosphatidylinositol glycan anchor biosynthesis class U protein n=1 Tax=Geodia barretti TaxID=519541 RepID=A0AA35RQU8_GEOBA|nr:Phosphatidylinositol glycan anchor biosynthesis class U protein [Geodia barretti]